MKDIFLVASGVLTLVSAIPYLRDIIQRKTKPRIVTWFNWSLLTGIATAAAIADHQWPSAVITGAATIATSLIVIFGLHYGDTKIESFDVACQLTAILGLVLWLITNDPLIAIAITVFVDFIAGLPTFRHAWQKPQEETASAFLIAVVGSLFAIAALNEPNLSGVLYPIYITLANAVLVIFICFSPHRHKQKS